MRSAGRMFIWVGREGAQVLKGREGCRGTWMDEWGWDSGREALARGGYRMVRDEIAV